MQEEFGGEIQLFEPDLAVAKGASLMGIKILAGEMIKEVIAGEQGVDKEEINLDKVDTQALERAAAEASRRSPGVLRLPSKDMAEMARRKIVNVSSKSFGVVAIKDAASMEEHVAFLIHNNTSVPAEVTETGFGTIRNNQRDVHVRVMEQSGQEESPEVSDNIELGEGQITGLPPDLPAGSAIHVTFRLEDDGTLKVSAVEPSSGNNLKLDIKVEGVMSQEEIEEKKGLLLKKSVS
jgi:molecular chaperone DnaK (HSP70)